MKLRKLASLVIAGAMLVSALPMTANATTNWGYDVQIDVGGTRVFNGVSSESNTYAYTNGSAYSQTQTDDSFKAFVKSEQVKTISGVNYEAVIMLEDISITAARPIDFNGSNVALGITAGKTVELTSTDNSNAYAVGLAFRDRFNGTDNKKIEQIAIYGAGTLVSKVSDDAVANWNGAAYKNIRAGIATTGNSASSGTGITFMQDGTPIPLLIDATKVIVDGNVPKENENYSRFNDGVTTVAAKDAVSYGISNNGSTITLTNGATLKAQGGTAAVDATAIVPADTATRKVQGLASTNYDGSNPVVVADFSAVDAATLATYKWIDVEEVAIDAAAPTLPSEPEETNVEMTVAGTSEVVDGKKNVGFTATVAADTYNSVLMKVDGDAKVYGWALGTAMTLDAEAEVGIQVNNVPEAATIAVKLSTAVLN